MEIRNIAIIAHVDHGKTTLTDALMKQCGFTDAGTMDSNALEQERGITIYAKNTSIPYKGTKINIVDTPGHADFGSEVERVLRSIDTVLLVVDAQEGPMPQTRFVLKKSLELGIKPIVVINKIDKPAARPTEVHEMVLELFMELGANDEQINFPTVFAIGREGIAKMNLIDESKDLTPLLDTIIAHVPPASFGKSDLPLTAQVFNLGYDNFLGRLAIARIYSGKIKTGANVLVKKIDGSTVSHKITKLFTFEGTSRLEIEEALAGDIVTVAGLPEIFIGETICANEGMEALPAIKIDEPTITLNFLVNNAPFAGKEGKYVTGRQIRDRLLKELEINVGLKVDFSSNEYFNVSGRGELHIAILLENMRREGFELQVSQPQAIIKNVDGRPHEPFEEVTIDAPEEFAGAVIEKLGKRRGLMTDMRTKDGQVRMIFEMPTRGILGYRGEFVIDTKGLGILCSRMIDFKPYCGEITKRETGAMVSMVAGKALGFSLWNLQDRGTLYIGPATEVYEGQIIGNTSKGEDMDVNPCKGKQLSNMRSSGNDEHIMLTPFFELSIERGLEIMGEDDYLEITPKSVRLRKKVLNPGERSRTKRLSSKD
ncbi:MAG: translational GTPase TypA [bacterium]